MRCWPADVGLTVHRGLGLRWPLVEMGQVALWEAEAAPSLRAGERGGGRRGVALDAYVAVVGPGAGKGDPEGAAGLPGGEEAGRVLTVRGWGRPADCTEPPSG